MSVQINGPSGSGPLSKVIAFLISVFVALAFFGFGVLVWIVARASDDGLSAPLTWAVATVT